MSVLVYSCTKLVAGTLYPAYGSFKAVKERNVKEYVKWMTYWIVYSLYSLVEEFTDILLAWVPFYYTLKICLIFWLVSPTTRGSSVLYRGLVHPTLTAREDDIDEFLTGIVHQGYEVGVRYARIAAQKFTRTMIETAIKGGGELVTTLKRSVSLGDLTEESEQRDQAPSLEKRRREIMTKSWHEDYQEGPRRVRQRKEGKEEMKGREGSVKKYKQPSSELRKSGRVGKMEYQEDEGSVSCSDSAYATLPRTSKRIRSQTMDAPVSRRSDHLKYSQTSPLSSSLKTSSSRSSTSLYSTASQRRRPIKPKSIQAKPNMETVQDKDFSMSYSESDAEEKRSCSFM